MQFVPLPLIKPLKPSSFHIFMSAFPTLILYSVWPALCTWNKIFSRSSGDTTVRETAPATPPAINEATTGCASCRCKSVIVEEAIGWEGCEVLEADG